MKIKTSGTGIALAATMSLLSLPARAQITGDLFTTAVSYGSPLTVQTINTGFGASTGAGGGDDLNGSELDAAYGSVNGGNLYLFLAGDVQGGTSPNSIQIFFGGGGATVGQTSLSTSISPLSNMNGSTFGSGFNATLGLSLNDYNGTLYTDAANYQSGGGGYVGSVGLSGGIGSGAPAGGSYSLSGFQEALNNTLVSTMNGGAPGTSYSGGAAVSTGLELEIPLADLGVIDGNIDVVADINNGSLNYLSNQLLPGLAVGAGNLGTSSFNNASYFTVPVPEPSSLALGAFSGFLYLTVRPRRRK